MAKDWDNIHVFVKFLKIFFDITLKVLISNVHFPELCLIYNFIQKYLQYNYSLLSNVTQNLRAKYNKC